MAYMHCPGDCYTNNTPGACLIVRPHLWKEKSRLNAMSHMESVIDLQEDGGGLACFESGCFYMRAYKERKAGLGGGLGRVA